MISIKIWLGLIPLHRVKTRLLNLPACVRSLFVYRSHCKRPCTFNGLFYFYLLSDISAWIEALGPENQFELTGISSYPISSYPKYVWELYEGKKSGPAEKLELSRNSS